MQLDRSELKIIASTLNSLANGYRFESELRNLVGADEEEVNTILDAKLLHLPQGEFFEPLFDAREVRLLIRSLELILESISEASLLTLAGGHKSEIVQLLERLNAAR